MQRMLFGLLIVGGISTLFSGCGGSGSDNANTVSVSGTVTLDGKPLAGAEINFSGDEFAGYGKTGSDGKYSLVQGASPGANKVTISKIEGGDFDLDGDMEEGLDAGQLEASGDLEAGGADAPKQLVPEDYTDLATTKLTINVPAEGTTTANFTLTTSN